MEAENYVMLYLKDHIHQNFESLLTSKELCDVIFEVGNSFDKKQFHCIKCLFAIHSPIFYELLYSQSHHKSRNCVIEILDITPDAFEYLRALFYGLGPPIKITNVIQIFHAANVYDIEPLKQCCLHFLYEITPSIYQINMFIKLLNELICYNYDAIIPDIINNLNLTQTHFEHMLKLDDNNKVFSNSPFQLIEQLLFLSHHNIFGNISQQQKWTAVMKWSLFQTKKHHRNGIINNRNNNYKYLKQFVQYFDFKSFDSEFFIENVAKLNILDDKLAVNILNYHCNILLNSIDGTYDNIINIANIISDTDNNGSIIKIQHYSGGYLCVNEFDDNNVNVRFADNNNNFIFDDYYEWIGIEDQNGFWKFQNVATSKYLCVTPKISDTNDHILKCNDISGQSLFCIFMIHITPWKHCRFEPIFIHPNYFISIKEKHIELSIKNGLYEEFKMIPISDTDNKIQNTNNNNNNMSLNEIKETETKENENEIEMNDIEIKENAQLEHPLMKAKDEILSKWKGDKVLTMEDKFGTYYLAIKGMHSSDCVVNKISDDLSEWLIQYHRDKEDIVRFKNKKSGKYLKIINQANHGYTIDCSGLENDSLCEFKISHSEHDWHLCRLKSVAFDKYCIGLSEKGAIVSHDIATDSLIYIRFE